VDGLLAGVSAAGHPRKTTPRTQRIVGDAFVAFMNDSLRVEAEATPNARENRDERHPCPPKTAKITDDFSLFGPALRAEGILTAANDLASLLDENSAASTRRPRARGI
jgi:hypothetical protein